ncbi:hypothetical protein T484DRAFT_1859111 [Baffinella frigidus]|nr:hypothetical protein T484DRAFT_1859111 [Cryptophyta sp. CCMP2293]
MFAYTAVVDVGRYEAWQEACVESNKMVYSSGMQDIEAAMLKALSQIGTPEEAQLSALQRRGRSLPAEIHVPGSSVLPAPTTSKSPTFRAERTPEARARRASMSFAPPPHAKMVSPLYGPATNLVFPTDTLEEAGPASRSPKLKQATDGNVFSKSDNAWETIGGRFRKVQQEVVERLVQENADPDLLERNPGLLRLFASGRAAAKDKMTAPKLPESKLSAAAQLAAVSALRRRKMSEMLRAPSSGQVKEVGNARTGKASGGFGRTASQPESQDRPRTRASRPPPPGWVIQRRTSL